MSREGHAVRGRGAAANPLGGGVAALVASGPDDTWLLPDDPFVNAGCRVLRAASQQELEKLCARHAPKLVFLPLVVAGEASLANLRRCLEKQPAPVVVVIATNDQINAAAEAMRIGAFDCLFKPFSPARLGSTIKAALKTVPRPEAPVAVAGGAAGARAAWPGATGSVAEPGAQAAAGLAGLIAASPQMRAVTDRLAALAPSAVPMFVTGEVGTGKSLVARQIHDLSARAGHPFVRLDCAALSPGSIEEELFGPAGPVHAAAGGTLFLDEICELDPKVQSRLLRLIESHATAGPAGEADIRLIATTRHDPRAAIRDGRLRAELYYRLHVAPLALPPLRARTGDAVLIARSKLRDYAEAEGRHFTGFSDAALEIIAAYPWPGNVRELLNLIWTIVLMHQGPLVTPDMLPAELSLAGPAVGPGTEGLPRAALAEGTGAEALVGLPLGEIERQVIEATIRAEGGSVPRAARVLGVSPSTLYRKREAWLREDKS